MSCRLSRSPLWLALTTSVLTVACRRSQHPTDEAAAAASSSNMARQRAELRRKRALQLPKQLARPSTARLREAQTRAASLPGKPTSWVLLAQAWIDAARLSNNESLYDNARAAVEEALRLDSNCLPALNLRALLLLNQHRFAAARDAARALVVKDPQDALAYGVLSDALLELGDARGALRAANKMAAAKPNLASYSRLSFLAWLGGKPTEAKRLIRLAFQAGVGAANPEPASWALVEAAKLFWHEGDYSGALEGFDLALHRTPHYPPAIAGKARSLASMGKHKRAIVLLRQLLERRPTAEAAWRLGDSLSALGQREEANKAYRRVIDLGRSASPRTLALFYATKKRQLDEAERLMKRELSGRHDTYTLDTWAWVLYRLGRLKQAKRVSDEARQLGTRDAMLLYHAGAIRIALGEITQGKRLVKDALRINPMFDSTSAAEARWLLRDG